VSVHAGVVLSVALLAGSCGGEVPPLAGGPGDPAATVVGYFAAVSAADCGRLRGVLTGEALERFDASGCQAVLDDHTEHGAKLLRVEGTRKDGRDPDLRLISVRMQMGADERTIIVGVRGIGAHWKIEQI